MFFLRSKPVKPINLSFDETMTKETCSETCEQLTRFNRDVSQNDVDLSNTYNDLEKELASGTIDKKNFAKKSKEY